MTTIRRAACTHAAALLALLALAILPGSAQAQSGAASGDSWRFAAAAGAWVPRSALIVAADGSDTRLAAGPSFSLELQYLARPWASVYASAAAGFSTMSRGTQISPGAVGPSDQVSVTAFTGGVVLALSTLELQPTLRLGGGIKGYFFDLEGADNQWRPTVDAGLGVRGAGAGPLELGVEIRVLPSAFDQAKLPTRGIVAQDQRQLDLVLAVGVSIRQ